MARLNVTVLGMAERLTGTNRTTGKPYDFRKVAFGFINQYGSADVCTNLIDGSVLDDFDVQVGKSYVAIVNQVKKDYYIDLIESIHS